MFKEISQGEKTCFEIPEHIAIKQLTGREKCDVQNNGAVTTYYFKDGLVLYRIKRMDRIIWMEQEK